MVGQPECQRVKSSRGSALELGRHKKDRVMGALLAGCCKRPSARFLLAAPGDGLYLPGDAVNRSGQLSLEDSLTMKVARSALPATLAHWAGGRGEGNGHGGSD
jgi:hypothetical protein